MAPHSTHDCFRPRWLLGLVLYIASQALGSTLALQYMRSEFVAPLGSASLIFNFLFARWLLGTKITSSDILGTLIVIIGVVGVIGFGNIRRPGIDQEANMSLLTLQALWARPAWLIHLLGLEAVTALILWLASIVYDILKDKDDLGISQLDRFTQALAGDEEEDAVAQDVDRVCRDRNRARGPSQSLPMSTRSSTHSPPGRLSKLPHQLRDCYRSVRNCLKRSIENWSNSRSDETLMKLGGLLWGIGAGLLAGQTLIFAKSYVKLVSNGFGHDGQGQPEDLRHPLSILILLLLTTSAIFQVWCLNKGLKVYESTLVVPVLFATYTASGFVNSLIYLHELPSYRTWVLFMVWCFIAVLVGGVFMLSSRKRSPIHRPTQSAARNYSSVADPEGEAQRSAAAAYCHHPELGARDEAVNKPKLPRCGSHGSSELSSQELKDHSEYTVQFIPRTKNSKDRHDRDVFAEYEVDGDECSEEQLRLKSKGGMR